MQELIKYFKNAAYLAFYFLIFRAFSINSTRYFRKSYIDQFAFLNHPNRNIKPPSIDDGRLAVAMGDSVNLYNRSVIISPDCLSVCFYDLFVRLFICFFSSFVLS